MSGRGGQWCIEIRLSAFEEAKHRKSFRLSSPFGQFILDLEISPHEFVEAAVRLKRPGSPGIRHPPLHPVPRAQRHIQPNLHFSQTNGRSGDEGNSSYPNPGDPVIPAGPAPEEFNRGAGIQAEVDGRPFPRLYCFVSNLHRFLDSRLRGNDRPGSSEAGRSPQGPALTNADHRVCFGK